MKTDPNTCAILHNEDRFWAIIHDVIAHPLMGLTLYCGLSKQFHDYTSAKAWPRAAQS